MSAAPGGEAGGDGEAGLSSRRAPAAADDGCPQHEERGQRPRALRVVCPMSSTSPGARERRRRLHGETRGHGGAFASGLAFAFAFGATIGAGLPSRPMSLRPPDIRRTPGRVPAAGGAAATDAGAVAEPSKRAVEVARGTASRT